MFYQITCWLSIGIVIGSMLMLFFWGWAIKYFAKKGRLFYRDESGRWLPKKPE